MCVLHYFSHVWLFVTQCCSPPGSSVHGDSPGKSTGMGCHALLQGNLPNPGIEPRFPALAGGFFTTSTTQEALIPAYQGLINDSDYYCWEDLQCKPFMDPWSSVGGRCEDIVFSVTAGFQVRWGLPYSDFAKASFGEWRGILCYKEQHLKTNLSVSHSELILRCSPFSLSASLSAKRSWGNSWNDSCIWSPDAFLERILL